MNSSIGLKPQHVTVLSKAVPENGAGHLRTRHQPDVNSRYAFDNVEVISGEEVPGAAFIQLAPKPDEEFVRADFACAPAVPPGAEECLEKIGRRPDLSREIPAEAGHPEHFSMLSEALGRAGRAC